MMITVTTALLFLWRMLFVGTFQSVLRILIQKYRKQLSYRRPHVRENVCASDISSEDGEIFIWKTHSVTPYCVKRFK